MSSFDPNAILKTKPGQIRLAAVGVGFLAMVLCAAAFDHQSLKIKVWSLQTCPSSAEFGRCEGEAAAQAALAFVIIAWLFSIAMLIVSALPSLSQNPQVRMVDSFGHIGAGVLAILGGLLSIWWVVNLFLAEGCDKQEFDDGYGGKIKISDARRSFCSKYVFATVNEDDGRAVAEAEKNAYKGGRQAQARGMYSSRGILEYSGHKGWIWIAGGVFAIAFGVLCIIIFVLAKRAPRGGPMMMGGMMTQQPSQAPMSMHPSQMTQQQQQQQNPDQQSVHPSQMTQQQG